MRVDHLVIMITAEGTRPKFSKVLAYSSLEHRGISFSLYHMAQTCLLSRGKTYRYSINSDSLPQRISSLESWSSACKIGTNVGRGNHITYGSKAHAQRSQICSVFILIFPTRHFSVLYYACLS